MRIISGKYKGRHLEPPKNITARPTTDFAKESLFNLFTNRLDYDGIDVLDLFAGTGGIGLEFVSRGARSVIAVEKAHVQQNYIIGVCKQLGVDNLQVVRGDAFRYLNACSYRFDVIFADPPYALETLAELPDIIFSRHLLKEGGIFVLEHSANNNFAQHAHFIEERNYGNVHFSFFE